MRLAWTGAVAVVAVSAAPALQFRNWQWFALAVTVAVVLPALTHDRHHSHVMVPDGAAPCGRDRSPVGRSAMRGRFAAARSVDGARGGEGCARDRGSPYAEVAEFGTAVGAVAALAWSVTALLGEAGTPGFVQAAGAPALALDTAAVLGSLLLLPRDGRPGGVSARDRTDTERPETDRRETDRPETERPGTHRPGCDRPGCDRPGCDRPGTDRPGCDRPGTDRPGTDRIAARLGALVVATAVAALGFRLGAGDGAGAMTAAAAVLIAGCPCALLLLPTPGPRRLLLRAEHGEGVLRAAAALHARVPLDHAHADPVGPALLAAARRRHPVLPGASDVDGDPATGLRGVVSELTADVVLAHAVLAGPPDWLRAHGVPPPADAGRSGGGPVWCIAWDGRARGRLEFVDAPRPGERRRRVATAVSVAAAGLGAGAAAAGALSPATAGVVPVATVLLVVALRMFPVPGRAGRGHPIGATSG